MCKRTDLRFYKAEGFIDRSFIYLFLATYVLVVPLVSVRIPLYDLCQICVVFIASVFPALTPDLGSWRVCVYYLRGETRME